ncbi:hypothetical protein SAMN05216411_11417 [Nitrosospira multiformis]|nr:hypothetical protein SAMN05216411_11417 [Nitrosospira multiformis]
MKEGKDEKEKSEILALSMNEQRILLRTDASTLISTKAFSTQFGSYGGSSTLRSGHPVPLATVPNIMTDTFNHRFAVAHK